MKVSERQVSQTVRTKELLFGRETTTASHTGSGFQEIKEFAEDVSRHSSSFIVACFIRFLSVVLANCRGTIVASIAVHPVKFPAESVDTLTNEVYGEAARKSVADKLQ